MPLPDLTSLSITSWAGIMGAAAIVGTCWRHVRTGLNWAGDLFVCRVIIKEETARAVMSYAWTHATRSPFGARMFGGVPAFVAPKHRVEVVPYEAITSEPRLFWFNRRPMVITVGFTGNDAPSIGNQYSSAMPGMLRFIRGTLDADTFIAAAVEHYNQLKQVSDKTASEVVRPKRFNIIRMHGSGGRGVEVSQLTNKGADIPPSAERSPEEALKSLQRGEMRLLSPLVADDLIERPTDGAKPFVHHPVAPDIMAEFSGIERWLKHEQWFRSRGIPWRQGVLLWGPTGTGKSTIVRNVAMQYDLPVYSFDLSTYDNGEFSNDWRTVMQNAPAIALLEDLDNVFQGRTNVAVQGKQRDGLTFDCLLNTISGVGSSDGVLLFVTTNKVDTLDEALGVPRNDEHKSTRPGRIDRAIYVGPQAEAERKRVAAHILSDYPELQAPAVIAGEGETAAQFQDRCAQLALAEWKAGRGPTVVEEPPMRGAPVKPEPTLWWGSQVVNGLVTTTSSGRVLTS